VEHGVSCYLSRRGSPRSYGAQQAHNLCFQPGGRQESEGKRSNLQLCSVSDAHDL
jgi:hypothetical protein